MSPISTAPRLSTLQARAGAPPLLSLPATSPQGKRTSNVMSTTPDSGGPLGSLLFPSGQGPSCNASGAHADRDVASQPPQGEAQATEPGMEPMPTGVVTGQPTTPTVSGGAPCDATAAAAEEPRPAAAGAVTTLSAAPVSSPTPSPLEGKPPRHHQQRVGGAEFAVYAAPSSSNLTHAVDSPILTASVMAGLTSGVLPTAKDGVGGVDVDPAASCDHPSAGRSSPTSEGVLCTRLVGTWLVLGVPE